jgi:hypothetical protein
MRSVEFYQALKAATRPCGELQLTPGEPGAVPVTKISDEPWWPGGVPRPACDSADLMSFVAQFALADVPGLERRFLASFHYCQQCALDGEMSFGWRGPRPGRGYNLTVFGISAATEPDAVGPVAPAMLLPHSVSLRFRIGGLSARS